MYNLDIKFLIVAIIMGQFIDWIFQLEFVFKNKNNKMSDRMIRNYTLFLHSFLYASMTYISVCIITYTNYTPWVWFILFLSHVIIDTRVIVRYIMILKGFTYKNANDYDNYGYMITGLDQRLHELVIVCITVWLSFK